MAANDNDGYRRYRHDVHETERKVGMSSDRDDVSRRVHVVTTPDAWRDISYTQDQEEFVIGPNGFLVVRSSDFMAHARPAYEADLKRVFGDGDWLKAGWGRVTLSWPIPFDLVSVAAHFFQEAWKRYRREEVLYLFLYYEKGKYELHHPKILSASECHVHCDLPEAPSDAVRFGSFHSHGGKAYHSSEDRGADASSPGIHLIIGDVGKPIPTLCCVCSDGVHCFCVSPLDVFALPQKPPIPTEWFVASVPAREPARRVRPQGFGGQ
jgi:hypothetical protein